MKCPECDTNLTKNLNQGCCLVIHNDDIFEENGKTHDHTEPCDYDGGIGYHCENNHKIVIPTVNECWCGVVTKSNDGGFGGGIRHTSETLPWKESADYYMRRQKK